MANIESQYDELLYAYADLKMKHDEFVKDVAELFSAAANSHEMQGSGLQWYHRQQLQRFKKKYVKEKPDG